MERCLARIDQVFGCIFMVVVMLNFAGAASRYLGAGSIIGSEEVQVYAMVWLIFLGAAVTAFRRTHLRMDVLINDLAPGVVRWRLLLEILLILVVCSTMVWVSGQFTWQIFELEQKSDAAEIPMWIPHASVVMGFVGIVVCSLYELKLLVTTQFTE